jgi:hypothetical protein
VSHIKSGGISPGSAYLRCGASSAEYDIENAPAFCFADAPMAEGRDESSGLGRQEELLSAVLDEGISAHDETGNLVPFLRLKRSGTSLFD